MGWISKFFKNKSQSSLPPEISLEEARKAVRMIVFCGMDGETRKAEAIFEDFEELCRKAPDPTAFASLRAQVLYNMILVYINAGDMTKGEELYMRLKALRKTAPNPSEILENEMTALFNLVAANAEARNLEKAEQLCRDFSELRKTLSDPSEAAVFEAKAVVNLISAEADLPETIRGKFTISLKPDKEDVNRLKRLEKLYSSFAELARDAPGRWEIGLTEAQAAFNIALFALSKTGGIEKMETLNQRIAQLKQEYPACKEIDEVETRAAAFMNAVCGGMAR